MEGHRPKKPLDQVRTYPELGEGTPSASNTIPIARSRPTSAGSKAASLSTAYVTRPKWALPRPRSASPRVSPQPLAPVGPSAPHHVHWFVHCVHHFERMLYDNAQLARVYLHAWQVTGSESYRTSLTKSWTMSSGKCSIRREVSIPPKTPIATGKKASSSFGRRPRSARFSVTKPKDSWPPMASPRVATSRARTS